MIYPLKCEDCGRFISNDDYDSNRISSRDVWNWDRTEIEDVAYCCVKCTDKAKKEETNENP
jgi:hypothetical protein